MREIAWGSAIVFPVRYPRLVVRVINNTGGTVLLNRLSAVVERSTPDERPLCVPANYRRPARSVLLLNEGSGRARKCVLRYRLQSMFERSRSFEHLPHAVSTDGFTRSWVADLTGGLAAEGIDMEALEGLRPIRTSVGGPKSRMPGAHKETLRWGWLATEEWDRKLREVCGPFEMPEARVLASFEQRDASASTMAMRFETTVSLLGSTGYHPIARASAPPDIALRPEGDAYEASMPLADAIKAGEVAVLNVRVGAPRPSTHRLEVQVAYNNDQRTRSQPLSLRVYVPRSSYDRMDIGVPL